MYLKHYKSTCTLVKKLLSYKIILMNKKRITNKPKNCFYVFKLTAICLFKLLFSNILQIIFQKNNVYELLSP